MPAHYRTEPEAKTEELKIKMDTGYAQKKRCRARNREVSPEGGKGSLGWKRFVKQVVMTTARRGLKIEIMSRRQVGFVRLD